METEAWGGSQNLLNVIQNEPLGRYGIIWGPLAPVATQPPTMVTGFNLRNRFLRHLADSGRHFAPHWILKGVQDIEANKMRINGVLDRVLKKHEFQSIFDATIQGPDLIKNKFGR